MIYQYHPRCSHLKTHSHRIRHPCPVSTVCSLINQNTGKSKIKNLVLTTKTHKKVWLSILEYTPNLDSFETEFCKHWFFLFKTHCSEIQWHSNALANKTQRLIGEGQEFATVYSAISRRRPDVMSNVACDWLTSWFYVADELTFGAK